jgi:membrane fusion protein (multidrug efflux system)
MTRSRQKTLVGILLLVVVVLVGGYVAKRSATGGAAAKRSAGGDSASVDSLAADTARAGGEGDDDQKKAKDRKDGDKKNEPDPVPIEVALASPRRMSSYYFTTATLEPERKVDVLTKVAGEVSKIHVEEGETVREGAVLCELDDRELTVALDEARINRDQQEREFARVESMYKEKLVSDKEYSDAKYRYELATNQYTAIAVRYDHTKIKAPFGGVVTRRFIEVGQNLALASPVFQIVDSEPLLIRMYLPENEVGDVRVGQTVFVEPDSDPGKSFTGRVVRIAPEVDQKTGTVKVTAETRGSGVPGSFARVRIITDTREDVLAIARRGLLSDAGELFVFLAEADSVRKVPVEVGDQDEHYAEVLRGVERGDSVVVVGTGGLRTGTKVKVVEPTMQDKLSPQDEATRAATD